jgi:hypothetical protein
MSKNSKNQIQSPQRATGSSFPWVIVSVILLVLGGVGAAVLNKRNVGANPPAVPSVVAAAKPAADPPSMEVNKAVMVTVELDFGPKIPNIADALREVERRYRPDDGQGRTFAILDAYGEPTADGKKLHLSMHLSTEKPGIGSLIFKRTGDVLWSSRIVPATNALAFTGKNLLILLDNGEGKTFTVDGSNNPANLIEARIKELGVPVSQFWPDGAEREATFLYSACGCPVKVKVRRVGDRTVRTKDLPVIFPDDPGVVGVITQLMGW